MSPPLPADPSAGARRRSGRTPGRCRGLWGGSGGWTGGAGWGAPCTPKPTLLVAALRAQAPTQGAAAVTWRGPGVRLRVPVPGWEQSRGVGDGGGRRKGGAKRPGGDRRGGRPGATGGKGARGLAGEARLQPAKINKGEPGRKLG